MRYLLTILSSVLILSAMDVNAQTWSYSWEPLPGPYGGTVYQMVLDHSGRLFAATSGGVFRSMDTGRTWVSANNGMTPAPATSLALDSSGGILVAGYGLYRSTNGGDSWNRIESFRPFAAANYGGVIVEPETKAIYYGAAEGLHKSTDYGATWQFLDTGIFVFRLHVQHGTIYGQIGSYIYRFRNATNYESERLVFPYTDMGIPLLATGRDNYLFLGGGKYGPHRSTDEGVTWEKRSNGIEGETIQSIVSSATGDLYVSTTKGTYRSTDNGDSWIFLSNSPMIPSGGVFVSNNNMVMAAGHGVLRSTDGWQTVQEFDKGLRGQGITSLATDRRGGIYVLTLSGEGHRSTDEGKTWEQSGSDLPTLNVTYPRIAATPDGSAIYVATWDGFNSYVYRSIDRGISWKRVGNLATPTQSAMIAREQGLVLVGKTDGTCRRSTNGGGNWSTTTISNRPIISFEVDSSGSIWACTDSALFRSGNRGLEWQRVTGMPGFRGLAIDATGRLIVGAVVDSKMYVRISEDSGVTWQSMALVPANPGYITVAGITGVVAADSGRIFISSTYQGVFLSRDSGRTWQQSTEGLDAYSTTALALTSSGDIVVGASGSGLFKINEQFIPKQEEKPIEVPDKTKLNLPYPNPFQNSILIPFVIAHNSHTVIDVFNTAGEWVDRLLDEEKIAGRYSLEWDAPYQANGYYFVRLRADGESMTLPVVLLR
jgi:ligand-binding sensor domain-containing protein